MLRIPPIGYARALNPYHRPPAAAHCAPGADWNALLAAKAMRPPPPYTPVQPPPWASSGVSVQQADLRILAMLSNYWPGRAPLEHLSTAMTPKNALYQRNLLLQTGMNSEHHGILVVFQQFSAKGASLPAVLEAVLMSPEYNQHVIKQRELMGLPVPGGAVNVIA
ncbi:MAG TPA: hypothetical protein VHC19_07065 [Pirellulales bacterium]|nr:hypothetical protein [Pirellulales bacterium]